MENTEISILLMSFFTAINFGLWQMSITAGAFLFVLLLTLLMIKVYE